MRTNKMTAKRDLTQSDLAAIAATPTLDGEPAGFDQAPANGGHVAARKPLQPQPAPAAPALRSSTAAVAALPQTPAQRVVTGEQGADGEIADDFDLRGYAFWHVRDGKVLTSGSSPALGEYHEVDSAGYQKALSDRMGSELYIRKGTLGAPAQDFSERIMGMTWDEIMAKQMRVAVITRIKPATLPADAIRVYVGSEAPADEHDDEEAEAPRF